MRSQQTRTVCWSPTWSAGFENIGLEHVVLAPRSADSVLLACDESGVPFRLTYLLRWDAAGCIRTADFHSRHGLQEKRLLLRSDGSGHWTTGDGHALAGLKGCIDIDIWPTPLTNSLPIWRSQLRIGERREFRMAWIAAPDLTVEAKQQAYTRLRDRLYLFESLDDSGFQATLDVDEDDIVLDYPGLFRRLSVS
ncbi:MAG: putative glycolipid-binding domain-containing protein [Gemmatimonadaceae bacterium]|nr:putative glycolipid-binding domain-containing protein [Gemmatimonadaceae bacterium]